LGKVGTITCEGARHQISTGVVCNHAGVAVAEGERDLTSLRVLRFTRTVPVAGDPAPDNVRVRGGVVLLASAGSALLVRRRLDLLDLIGVLKTREWVGTGRPAPPRNERVCMSEQTEARRGREAPRWLRSALPWLMGAAVLVALVLAFLPEAVSVDLATVDRGDVEVAVEEDGWAASRVEDGVRFEARAR
jgi:hypothetical protein